MPSIVDIAPAADWDEREAADLYGIRFDGHEPLRPLVDHDLDLTRWTVRVRGHDPYQIAVGPIHAGVIESGHFRFHVVGDRILHLDARLFYKREASSAPPKARRSTKGSPSQRACAACAVTNGVAYAHACEEALGLAPTAELSVPERSCSSSSGCGATSTTSPPCAPASAWPQATTSSPRSPSAHVGSTRR